MLIWKRLFFGENPTGWASQPFIQGFIIVTVAVFIILVIALLAGNAINHGIHFDFSPEGWNHLFFGILKLPLSWAAAAIAMLAILVSNFRAQQQQIQIEVTQNRNVFSNYYEHFKIMCERIESSGALAATDAPNQSASPGTRRPIGNGIGFLRGIDLQKLHQMAFPEAQKGVLYCSKFISGLRTLQNKFDDSLKEIGKAVENYDESEDSYRHLVDLTIKALNGHRVRLYRFARRYGIDFELKTIQMPTTREATLETNIPQLITETERNWYLSNLLFSEIVSCNFAVGRNSRIHPIRPVTQKPLFNYSRFREKCKAVEITD